MFRLLRELWATGLPKNVRIWYIENGYFGELPSPKGEPMQLDWYAEIKWDGECIRIAYEHQGRQHFRHNPTMMSHSAYRYLRRCDRRKSELCRKAGIALVTIRYDHPMTSEFLLGRFAQAYPELASLLEQAGVAPGRWPKIPAAPHHPEDHEDHEEADDPGIPDGRPGEFPCGTGPA